MPISHDFYNAMTSGDVECVRMLVESHPELMDYDSEYSNWLEDAAGSGQLEVVRFFLGHGHDVDRHNPKAEDTALNGAVDNGHVDTVRILLEAGADVEIGRTLFGAINCEDEETGLAIVRLLVDYKVNINRVFNWLGDDSILNTPLSFALLSGKLKIADYLESLGAVMPPPVTPKPTLKGRAMGALGSLFGKKSGEPQRSMAEQVVANFETHDGPVTPKSLNEIVPTGLPIAFT